MPNDTKVRGYLIDTGVINTKLILGIKDFISEEVVQKAGIGDQTMTNIWGVLYDESRRNRMLAVGSQEELTKVVRPTEWNDLVIRCTGKRIQIWVNGFQTVDYMEEDDTIEQSGIIGLKLHGGSLKEYFYRNIAIKELGYHTD